MNKSIDCKGGMLAFRCVGASSAS